MNNWIIVGIIAGLLIVGGISFVAAVSYQTDKADAGIKCLSCGGTCTAAKNCGFSTCGATQGKACTCGQK